MDEGLECQAGHGLGPGQQSQQHRQQDDLDEHEQRGGGQQPGPCSAGQPREHEDVVDAGGQHHEQHAHEEGLIVGDQARQRPDDQRDENEVQEQDGREEADVAQRGGQLDERDAQEGRVEEEGQDGGECGLGGAGDGGDQEPRGTADGQRREVERHLVALTPRDEAGHRRVGHPQAAGSCSSWSSGFRMRNARTTGTSAMHPASRNAARAPGAAAWAAVCPAASPECRAPE